VELVVLEHGEVQVVPDALLQLADLLVDLAYWTCSLHSQSHPPARQAATWHAAQAFEQFHEDLGWVAYDAFAYETQHFERVLGAGVGGEGSAKAEQRAEKQACDVDSRKVHFVVCAKGSVLKK